MNEFRGFDRINRELFNHRGAIITRLSWNGAAADASIISQCGSLRATFESGLPDILEDEGDFLFCLLSEQSIWVHLGDCDLGEYTKAELFRHLYDNIVSPIQCASVFSAHMNPPCQNLSAIKIEGELLRLTGISHYSGVADKLRLDLHGIVTGADQFNIWSDELPFLKSPVGHTLEECALQAMPRLLELIYAEELLPTVEAKRAYPGGQMRPPRSPQELWKMHSLMGTLGYGHSIYVA